MYFHDLKIFSCVLAFISHSTSVTQMKYIFRYLLPDLSGKIIVDVGSRFGPVLYGVCMELITKMDMFVFSANDAIIIIINITKYVGIYRRTCIYECTGFQ